MVEFLGCQCTDQVAISCGLYCCARLVRLRVRLSLRLRLRLRLRLTHLHARVCAMGRSLL